MEQVIAETREVLEEVIFDINQDFSEFMKILDDGNCADSPITQRLLNNMKQFERFVYYLTALEELDAIRQAN
jgi:hypothetical protein